ncbi:hypothetical protein MCOR25_008725 [Pyricularia grisea]|nr:hypothetical protein MCOR25_008725 [Pyricularia grisea]
MLGSRASSYNSSGSSSGRRYRPSGYPPSSTFPSFTSYTSGSQHYQHHGNTHHQSSSSTSSPALASSLGHHHGSKHKTAATASSAIMSDGHSETSETPTRKRIAVAVQTTLTDMRHANEGGNSTAPNPHLECGYNMEVSRAAAHRASMAPLPMPNYAVDLSGEVPYHQRPSYSSGYGSRPTAAASSSYYAASSGTWSGYSTEDEYPTAAPYYPGAMTDMGYSAWGGSSGGSASGTRSSSRSGPAAGSMYVDLPAPVPATAFTHGHHLSHQQSNISSALHHHHHHPHHLSPLVHRPAPAIPVSAAAAAAVTAPMPSPAPLAAVPGAGHHSQGVPQSYHALQYPYPAATPSGVVGHQSCSVVYMPQPTALRLGSSQFIPDALPNERLTTSPSNSPSPHSQFADTAAAPSTARYSIQPLVKMEATASPGPNSNRASTTSPACSSTTPRTSIGSVGGHEEQKSQVDEVKGDEERQQQQQQQRQTQDQAHLSPTAATNSDVPEVANNLPDAIFSDSMQGPSMAGYEYAESSNSSPYHNHAGPSTTTAGSSPASVGHRRGMSSTMNGYAHLPTPASSSNSHHHQQQQQQQQHQSHHGAATGSHPSAYQYSQYQGSGYHHAASTPDHHHHHGADYHRSSMGHRR